MLNPCLKLYTCKPTEVWQERVIPLIDPLLTEQNRAHSQSILKMLNFMIMTQQIRESRRTEVRSTDQDPEEETAKDGRRSKSKQKTSDGEGEGEVGSARRVREHLPSPS